MTYFERRVSKRIRYRLSSCTESDRWGLRTHEQWVHVRNVVTQSRRTHLQTVSVPSPRIIPLWPTRHANSACNKLQQNRYFVYPSFLAAKNRTNVICAYDPY